MNFVFISSEGKAIIDQHEQPIKNITLKLSREESYIQFTVSYSFISINATLHELIQDISQISFTDQKGYNILIPKAVWSKPTISDKDVYIIANKQLISSVECTLKCEFIDFCIEKGKHCNSDYEMKFFISKHNFTQDFTINLNSTDISFNYRESCFIFPKTKVYSDKKHTKCEEYKKIFNAIQHIYALYYGHFFRKTHTEFKGSDYHKIYGNINEDFELYASVEGYYFCNYKDITFIDFLKEVFPRVYEEQKDERDKNRGWRLNLLIHYYLLFTRTNNLQIQFLLLSVFMESLKYSYGKYIAQLKERRAGEFLKENRTWVEGLIYNQKNVYSFEEMIQLVYKKLDIQDGYIQFITKRNDVVHSGTIEKITRDKIFPLENQVREILKNIIEFKGTLYYRDSRGGEYR